MSGKFKLNMFAFGLRACKPKGRWLTDHQQQHKDNPCQGTNMKTSSPPEGLGAWLPEMETQDESIRLPTWQQLFLAWSGIVYQPRETGSSHGLRGREAAASQHQHGASLQSALAETKRGKGKSFGCPASGLKSKIESSTVLMERRICSKTFAPSGMQSEQYPDDSSLHNGFEL